MGGSGIDTSQLLTPFDTEGYNCSFYALTVQCCVRIALSALMQPNSVQFLRRPAPTHRTTLALQR
jgi:hypothetical protein